MTAGRPPAVTAPGARALPVMTGPGRLARTWSGRRSAEGFTLLEILLALTIAGALMAVVVPNFGPALARAQLTSATRDVASALRHARGQAVIRGREAEFELDVDRHRYKVTGRSKAYALPGSVDLTLYTAESETVDEGTGRIRFYPDGSATGGRVTLAAGKETRAVDVNWLTGEVRIRDNPDED